MTLRPLMPLLPALALLLGACALPQPAPGLSAGSDNVAVVSLFNSALQDRRAGHFPAADATLERALRIEPHNPNLWQALARVRLAQGQYRQAEALAQRASSLSGKNAILLSEDWRIIGKAREQSGDAAGDRDAYRKADRPLR
ncbi:MAG: tetratricopeptide repeat protein [Acidiferrobacterales bacterium]